MIQVISLKVDKADIAISVHENIPCAKCHTDVSMILKDHVKLSTK